MLLWHLGSCLSTFISLHLQKNEKLLRICEGLVKVQTGEKEQQDWVMGSAGGKQKRRESCGTDFSAASALEQLSSVTKMSLVVPNLTWPRAGCMDRILEL